MKTTLTSSAKRMIKKYGKDACLQAYNLYTDNGTKEGYIGGRGVAYMMEVSTNTADALINAGVELVRIKSRLDYLREEIRQERISYEELCELQSLSAHIDKDDVVLLWAAGVSEF